MNKKALFIIPPERFNEDELFKPKKALENAGVKVTLASTITGEITGDYRGKATRITSYNVCYTKLLRGVLY